MSLIVDECLADSTLKMLKELGFTLLTIGEILEWGAEDEKIYHYAAKHQLPILTHDMRFGQIFHTLTDDPPVTIIIQTCSPHPGATNDLIKKALAKIDIFDPKYAKKLIIITEAKVRIRTKP